jgi:hypothetical protein
MMQNTHLPDPPENHCSSLGALLQGLVLKKHVIPAVLDLELIIPEEISHAGDASSKIVPLRYCGGPFWNEANTQINQFKVISSYTHAPNKVVEPIHIYFK